MQGLGVMHFDVDLFNVVTGGERAYIADHGLVMDPTFDLSTEERKFLGRNRHFDQGNLYLAVAIRSTRCTAPNRRPALTHRSRTRPQRQSFETAALRLIYAVDQLDERGLLDSGPGAPRPHR